MKSLYLRKLSTSNVYGSAFGLNYYYTTLYLGEKRKRQTYILDTGSSITTSPCQPFCKHCGKHINSYYTVDDNKKVINCKDEKCRKVKSQCGKEKKCSLKVSYTEGSSLEGIYINELVRFGDINKEEKGSYVPIGCTTNENNLFFTQRADGIMGLSNSVFSFVSLLNDLGIISNNVFSLCFAQIGGYFSINKINTTLHKEEISYIPFESLNYFYEIKIKSISVNMNPINIFNEKSLTAFIDSGTTLTYFPYEIFNGLVESVKNICNSYKKKNSCGEFHLDSELGICFDFNSISEFEEAITSYWPNITFEINNYNYIWSPEKYVFNGTINNKIRGCFGFNKVKKDRITLGSTWMIGHEIIFDRDNKKIGFVESNCEKNNEKNLTFIGVESNDDYDKNFSLPDYSNLSLQSILYILTFSLILLIFLIFFIVGVIRIKNGKKFFCFKGNDYNLIGIENYPNKITQNNGKGEIEIGIISDDNSNKNSINYLMSSLVKTSN